MDALDLLTDGRMRLGMGIGAVEVEFKLLGMDDIYHQRGARLEEQIEVLRLLWTTAPASFEGRWHNFPAVALNPQLLATRPGPRRGLPYGHTSGLFSNKFGTRQVCPAQRRPTLSSIRDRK